MAESKPPKKVVFAIVLFCIALVPGLFRQVILMKALDSPNHVLLAGTLIVAYISFFGFMIYKIYQEKDYARSIFIILILTAITSNIIGITPPMDNTQLSIAFIGIEIILTVIGITMIYHKDSSGWFRLT